VDHNIVHSTSKEVGLSVTNMSQVRVLAREPIEVSNLEV